MLRHIIGDVLSAEEGVIAHVTNNVGVWGGGVSGPIGRKYPEARLQFARVSQTPGIVGRTQLVFLNDSRIWVANMFAQRGVIGKGNSHPLSYPALECCLADLRNTIRSIAFMAKYPPDSIPVHMPRIGAGLAGGDWTRIEEIINEQLPDLDVTIYTLEEEKDLWPAL